MWAPGSDREPSNEEGQALPALLVLVVAILALGVALFQVARAADLRAGAQTGADAAALAAAQTMPDRLAAGLRSIGVISIGGIDHGAARAAAGDYAGRNGTTVVDYRPSALGATVGVESDATLDGEQVPEGARGTRGAAEARAEVAITYLLGVPGSSSSTAIAEDDLSRLARAAGIPNPVPPDSALRRYGGNCARGVDVANLDDALLVAILRAEAALGAGLDITSGHRSLACDSERSMHTYGLAIDVGSPGLLAPLAAGVGLCRPFPGTHPTHFALASSPECGGRRGTLAPGSAYPDLGAYVAFHVRLVALEGG